MKCCYEAKPGGENLHGFISLRESFFKELGLCLGTQALSEIFKGDEFHQRQETPRGFAPGNVLMAFIRSSVFPAHSRAGSWLHRTPRGWWELLASISHRLQSQAVQPRSSELVEAGMGSAPGHSRVVTPSATKGPGLGPAWGFFSIPGVI